MSRCHATRMSVLPGFKASMACTAGVKPLKEITCCEWEREDMTDRNIRVSFKLSHEAAIKLREIALTNGELLRGLGVLAVQLGNESQICISSPLNFNLASSVARESPQIEKPAEEGFDSELTDSLSEISEGGGKISEEEADFHVDRGVREVDENVAYATAASVKVCQDDPTSNVDTNKASLTEKTTQKNSKMNAARNALYHEIHYKKCNESRQMKEASADVSLIKNPQELTPGTANSPNVNNEGSKFDGPTTTTTNVSFAQHLINLSKQYRSENPRSPTSISNDKYYASDTSRIVGRDHVLRCFSDKPEDFMGLNVNNSLLFDSYGASTVKSAEELSKEQSEMSPTNLDSMSVSSADSLFEEARLGSVDELRLSPSDIPVSTNNSSQNNSPSPEIYPLEAAPSPSKNGKSKRSMKFQKLLKGQTGIVCELCMHPVQKSYSCYQPSYAPKEILHLFQDGSSCVRVCRRCLPYKAPKGYDKNSHKKGRKIHDQMLR